MGGGEGTYAGDYLGQLFPELPCVHELLWRLLSLLLQVPDNGGRIREEAPVVLGHSTNTTIGVAAPASTPSTSTTSSASPAAFTTTTTNVRHPRSGGVGRWRWGIITLLDDQLGEAVLEIFVVQHPLSLLVEDREGNG